jgi:3-methyladenine DNA glycosylase AlkD
MHKAVGWMLREVGRRCELTLLRGFLERHAATMPRTALRYAIEHLSPSERAKWMRLR